MTLPNPVSEREYRTGLEGWAQYMLASLLLGERPAGQNRAGAPSPRGARLLELIDAAAFGSSPSTTPDIYWEFKLQAGDRYEENKWPDLAARWPDRLLMLELKTGSGSVRDGQVDEYLDLALHNYPLLRVDLIFLTKDPIEGHPPGLPARARYANLTWEVVANSIDDAWNDCSQQWELGVATVVSDYYRIQLASTRLAMTGASISSTPDERGPTERPATSTDLATEDASSEAELRTSPDFAEAILLAEATESDKKPRRYGVVWPSKSAAQSFGTRVIEALRQRTGTPVHTGAWVDSAGKNKTSEGLACGWDLCFSWNKQAR